MSMAAVKPALVGSSKSAFKGSRVSAVAPKKVAGGRATLQVRTPEVASPSPSAVRAPARGDANAPAPAIARGLEARAPRRAPRGRGPRPRAIAPRARRERARTDGTRKRNRGATASQGPGISRRSPRSVPRFARPGASRPRDAAPARTARGPAIAALARVPPRARGRVRRGAPTRPRAPGPRDAFRLAGLARRLSTFPPQ